YFRKECPLNSGYLRSIEIIRRDLRNRITHEPDPEIPLGSNR
ncbi:hypothetical protein ACU2QC_001878, partial [Escherichia coli]